jgi:hypothetical protein
MMSIHRNAIGAITPGQNIVVTRITVVAAGAGSGCSTPAGMVPDRRLPGAELQHLRRFTTSVFFNVQYAMN